jgi:hypothetical protein
MGRILLAGLLLVVTQAFGQGLILPSGVSAKAPLESIAQTARVFSGKWEGLWDGRMPHVLLVEEVKSGAEATVLYAWQEPVVENAWGAGWYRTAASIDGNTLRVPLRNGTRAWYELLPDGTLKASYQRANSSSQSQAVMRKVEP